MSFEGIFCPSNLLCSIEKLERILVNNVLKDIMYSLKEVT